jgi:hypothetical protein
MNLDKNYYNCEIDYKSVGNQKAALNFLNFRFPFRMIISAQGSGGKQHFFFLPRVRVLYVCAYAHAQRGTMLRDIETYLPQEEKEEE